MATPVIFTITPSRGPTTGRSGVHIYGDNFRIREVDWAAPGVAPDLGPTVEVLFGGEACSSARVLRSNRLFVLAPPSPIADTTIRMVGNPLVTFAHTVPDTLVRSAGSWRADGFCPGQYIHVDKSLHNNATFRLGTVSPSTLTLTAAGILTAESLTAGVEIDSHAYGEGKVDVVVRNLDDQGVLIPGESVTATDAYTYARVQLATETGLARLVRRLIREFRKQIIPNVVIGTHTEYDAETGDRLNTLLLAELPGIALNGPELVEDRFFSLNGMLTTVLPSGEIVLRPAPYTVDLIFAVVGVSDSQVELLNLMALATQVVDRNPFIYLDRDEDDPSLGQVRYEFDFVAGGSFSMMSLESVSNIRAFSGSVVIRGFDLEELAGFTGESIVEVTQMIDEIVTSLDQTGESYDVGPSPGG